MLFQHNLTSVLDTVMSKILFPRLCDLEAVEVLLLTVNVIDCKQYWGSLFLKYQAWKMCRSFKTSVATLILAVWYGQQGSYRSGSGSCDLPGNNLKQSLSLLPSCVVLGLSPQDTWQCLGGGKLISE